MPISDLLFNIFLIAGIVIFCSVAIGVGLYFYANKKRAQYEKAHEAELNFLQIKVPPQNEVEIAAAEQMFAGLAGLKKKSWKNIFQGQNRVSFEIIARKDGIGFYIVVPDEYLNLVEKLVNGAYPQAEIDIINPYEIWDRGEYTAIANFNLSSSVYFPIKTFADMKVDPMSIITSAMTKLEDNEVVALQYIVTPSSGLWRKLGSNYIKSLKKPSSDDKPANVDTSKVEGIEKKINKPGFDVAIRIVSISQNKEAAERHLRTIGSAFDQFTDVKFNKFSYYVSFSAVGLLHEFIYRHVYMREWVIPIFNYLVYKNSMVLNTEELATIYHLPNKNVQTPNIIWLRAKRSQAPANIPDHGLYLGFNSYRGVTTPIYIKDEDRRRHMYIIGQTGTGKSQYMMSLVLQDIFNGKGLALIDPHGSDVQELLEKIPESRLDDVILFDASDRDMPMGLNILEVEDESEQNVAINAFIGLLYKLYDPNRSGIIGPQLERTVRNVMLTAMIDKESTLVDVLRLLIDTDYSKKFIPFIKDPLVKRYWTDEIAKTSDFHKSEKMGYMVSKFDRFVTESSMRNIIGQPKTALNFKKLMAEKKIVLVDLSKGKIGEENSTFLGLILVPKILAAALDRAKILGKEDFPDFYLYVDEFQNFATPDFATILSEARKYKLNLVVAHQFITQLTEEIKGAIFGNVGSINAFRVGTDDAEFLQKQFDPTFTTYDIINNPIGNCYAKLLIDGYPSVPFSMAVDWNSITKTPKSKEMAERIKDKSRRTYGRPVAEVEEYINRRSGFGEAEALERKIPF